MIYRYAIDSFLELSTPTKIPEEKLDSGGKVMSKKWQKGSEIDYFSVRDEWRLAFKQIKNLHLWTV